MLLESCPVIESSATLRTDLELARQEIRLSEDNDQLRPSLQDALGQPLTKSEHSDLPEERGRRRPRLGLVDLGTGEINDL